MQPRKLRALVAKNIRALADERGMTLNALADFAAVSRSQLFSVLAKSTSASIDWLAKVATALEVEPWRLLAPTQEIPANATDAARSRPE